MRDGRAVYIGAERVDDVTAHPAFREGARTIAGLYDLKADPARRELFSFDSNGEPVSLYWLRCRSRDDLARRMRCCKAIADFTYGFVGRSPDQVSGLIAGLAMNPGLLDALRPGCGQNLLKYYDHASRNDLYLSFAVTPASGRKSADLFPGQQRDDPNLQVVAEDDTGVTVSGMKMLATSAVYADEILIGNLTPIDEKLKSEAITAALPLNAPGVSLWSRQPYAQHVAHQADYPMSYRYDETDSVLVCDRVKIPWERVFLHDNALMSRRIYIETPANCYQNHQSNIRFWSKMGLITGLASRICQANGTDRIPAVREVLGPARLARSADRRHGARPDRRLGGVARGLCHAEPPHHVCGAELVPGAPHRDRRHPAHAARRLSAGDAGLDRRRHRRSLARPLRALVEDADGRIDRAAQALQARLGHRRHRVRRPPHALREVLRRQLHRRPQPERPRGAVGALSRHRR
ncbi:MAG: 4-hydroxyphenylacetate 3-hydroxylase family protein [Xanthobacteraceae bacterium]|nr:4-hydroxyphenylacetate 3-hydroxylase family protein [Xanthobacteraceae bacterium]